MRRFAGPDSEYKRQYYWKTAEHDPNAHPTITRDTDNVRELRGPYQPSPRSIGPDHSQDRAAGIAYSAEQLVPLRTAPRGGAAGAGGAGGVR